MAAAPAATAAVICAEKYAGIGKSTNRQQQVETKETKGTNGTNGTSGTSGTSGTRSPFARFASRVSIPLDHGLKDLSTMNTRIDIVSFAATTVTATSNGSDPI